MNNLKKSQKGVVLLESLIAAVIVALTVVTISYIVIRSLSESTATRASTAAINLAQEKMEDLRQLALHADCRDVASGSQPSIAKGGASFDRSWIVSNQCGGSGNCRNVLVSVAWGSSQQDVSGNPITKDIQLSSNITCADPVQGGIAVLALNGLGVGTTGTSTTGTSTTGTSTTGTCVTVVSGKSVNKATITSTNNGVCTNDSVIPPKNNWGFK